MPLTSGRKKTEDEYWDSLYGENNPNNIKSGAAAPPPPPPEPEPEGDGNFVRGLKSGADNMQALGGGLKALSGTAVRGAGEFFESESLKDAGDRYVQEGMEYYQEQTAEAAENAPEVTFQDIDSATDFGAWAAYTMGSVVPDLAGMVATGGVGGLLAKQAVKQGVGEMAETLAQQASAELVKEGLEQQAANKVAREMAEKFAKDKVAKLSKVGATAGAFLYGTQQGASSTFARTLEETGEEAPLAAIGAGLTIGALNAVPAGAALNKFLPKGKASEAVEFISGSVTNKPPWIGQFVRDVTMQMGAEGGTEALQLIVEEEVVSYVNNNYTENEQREYFDYLSNERKRSALIESATAGFLFGKVTGVAGGAVKKFTGGYDTNVNLGDDAKEVRTRSVNDPEFGNRIRLMYEDAAATAERGNTRLDLGDMTPTERPVDPVTGELAVSWNENGALNPETNRPYTQSELNLAVLTDYNVPQEPVEAPEQEAEEPVVSAEPENLTLGEDTLPPPKGVRVPEGVRDSGPAHRWDGELSPVEQPVQDQLLNLSVAAKTPEAMDPNNTDVVVEAIDQDDVDRVFDRNESLTVATKEKPKGKSLPTIDEVYGDRAQEVTDSVAGVMADLSANGVPKSFIDSVTGIYVHKESEVDAPALTGRDGRGISINHNLIAGSLVDQDQLSELAWTMTHEVYHAGDFAFDLSSKDSRFAITIDEEADAPTVVMGDIMQEIYKNWADGTELGKRFDYPFNDLSQDIADLEQSNGDLNSTYRQEVFAQLGALFHSNPKQLQELAPQAYTYIKDIRDSNLRTAPVQETTDEPSPSQADPDTTQPEGISGEVRAPPESGSVEVVQPEPTGPDGEASAGDGSTDTPMAGQVQEETGQRERPAVQEPEVIDEQPRTEVALKSTDKKPTFKKAVNWQETGEYVVTFEDGDRYTLYFDDNASEAEDADVSFESVDGKITEFPDMLGATKQEAINALQEHRQKLIDAGESSYNPPLNPEVGDEVQFKAFSFIDEKSPVTEKQLRAKFKSLADNQFERLKENLTAEQDDRYSQILVEDGKYVSYGYVEERDLEALKNGIEVNFIKKSDLPEVAQKITASDVLYGDESLDIVGTSRNGATVVVDLARAFDARVKDANEGKNLGEQNDENTEVLSDLIAHEAVQAMKTDGNAGEWYQEKVANAMSMAATEFPELSSDPNAKFAFTSIMAITSNGASVPENSVNTFDIYQEYRQSKVFPDFGVGKEAGAMKNAFALLNALIDKQGIDATREFMDQDVTVKELKDVFDLSVSGELMGTKLKGSAIIGPKIGGGFYQNLNGNFDPLTMDRWFMRTWGRLSGTLMADAERKLPVQLAKFREVALGDDYRAKLKKDGINRSKLAKDDQYATDYATKVQAAYANGGFKEKNTINKASNTFKNSQGEKQAPQNGKEREYIRSVMRKALDKVNATSGQDPVNMGALQAIIWYPEKDLYKQLGVGNAKSEPTDYETEFGKIVQSRQERGQSVSGSVGTTQQSGTGGLESDLQPAVQDADQRDGGQASQTDEGSIDTPPEEVSFIQKKINNAKNNTLDDGTPSTNQFSYNDEIDAQADLARRLKDKKIYKSLVDRYAQLEDFENQAAEFLETGRLPAGLSPRDQENLSHGKVQQDLDAFHQNYVDPLGDLIAEIGVSPDAVGTYLIAKHAAERNDVIAEKVKTQRARNIAGREKQIEALQEDIGVDHSVRIATLENEIKRYDEIPLAFQDTGSGMTYAEAESVLALAEREGTKSDMDRIANKVYEMLQFQRDLMVESGLLDEDSRADWEETYEFYVPLKGFAAEEKGEEYLSGDKSKGFSVVGSESMKAKGRKTLPVNPLFTAIEDVQKKIIRARKNETAQTLLNLLSELGDSPSYTIYNNNFRPMKDSDELTMQDLKEMSNAKRADNVTPKYIEVKNGGQIFFIEFKSDSLNHALQNMSVPMLSRANDDVSKMLTYATHFQTFRRNMLINYNPSWGLVNPMKDVQTGLMYALSEMDKKGSRVQGKNLVGKMAASYLPSMRSMYRVLRGKPVREGTLDQYAVEFMEDGASTGMMLVKDQEEQLRILKSKLKKGYTREALRYMAKGVEDFNTTMENSIRLAAYVEARKAGTDRATAATLAKDLTVNFNRKGENTAVVNAGFLFFNAAVQGNVNMAQALGSDKGKYTAARGVAAGLVAFGAAQAAINILMSEDDDDGEKDYADLPEHAKNRSLLFMYGTDEGFGLPAPYGWNFFTNIGRLATETAFEINTPEESALYLWENILLNFVPIAPSAGDSWEEMARGFYPDILEVHQDMLANKNFFGSDIYIEQNPFIVEKSNSYNSRRSTAKPFKIAAEFLNDATGGDKYEDGYISWNPDKMEYIYEYFLGGVGRFASQSGDVITRMVTDEEYRKQDLPIVGTFFETPSEYEDRFEYYDNWEETRKIEARFKEVADAEELTELQSEYRSFAPLLDGGSNSLYKTASRDLSNISKSRKIIERQDIPEERRRVLLDELLAKENMIFDIYNKAFRKASKGRKK